MRYFLAMLFAVLIISFTPAVFGPPFFSDQDKLNAAEVVLTGEIISLHKPEPPPNMLSSLDTIYEIKVDKYIKNPQDGDTVSVIARGGPDADVEPRSGNVDFDVGDLVYLFLNYDDAGMLRVNVFTSYRIDVLCEKVPDELSHLTDPPSKWEYQTTDSDLNEKQFFAVNEEIVIRYDTVNPSPTTKTFTYDLTVHDGENKEHRQVFHAESKEITLPACVGHGILEWRFTPTQARDYFVDIRSENGGMGFGFPVTEDSSAPSYYYDQPLVEHPVLKQHKMKVDDDNLMCKRDGTVLAFRDNGKPACLTPDTLAKLLERGWIGKKQFVPTPDLNLFDEASSSEIAFDAAHAFLDSSKTFTFDGTERNGGFGNLAYKAGTPPTYLLEGHFSTDTSGYGDRTNQEWSEIKTPHNIVVKIEGPTVVYAVIDNQWDEINQKFIAQRSEDFKDFEVRYQKFFGQEEKDYHIKLESRSGLMRITITPNDTFYLVKHSEFERFWKVVTDNEFFDIKQNAEHCDMCNTHSLNIESGGTHNTVSWYDGDAIDQRLSNVFAALDDITENQDDAWPT